MAVNRDFAKDYFLGGGELYIKLKNESNYRYFGATSEFKIKVNVDKLEHKNSESATQVTDLEIVKEVKADISFATEVLSKEILALAFGGEYVENTQSAGTITDQDIGTIKAGAVFELGKRKVSNVVVEYDSDGNGTWETLQEDVDYSVNSEFGTIEFAKGIAADGKNGRVSFDYAEVKEVEITALKDMSKEVSLRFVSNPQSGKPRQTTIHRTILTMDGDYNLKSPDKIDSLSFSGKVLKDDTKPEGKQFFETILLEG